MKRVRSLTLAFAACGLAAAAVSAEVTGGYPITGRYAAPALLPLPAMSGPWTQSSVTPASGVAGAGSAVQAAPTVTYVVPSTSYVAARGTTPSVQPSTRPSSAISAPSFPHMAYNRATQEEVPAQPGIAPPPVPTVAPTPVPANEPVAVSVSSGTASVYEEAASGGWGGDCGVCMPSCCPTWYGYVGGVVMGRDRPNRSWTTFETGNNANQLMYFPDTNWGGGAEATIGYSWCGTHGCDDGCGSCSDGGLGMGCAGNACGSCGGGTSYRHGLEITYWGVWDIDGEDSRRSETNQLSTPIDLGLVDINVPGQPASVFFDNAREHRVRREDDFHNVEINLVDFSTQYDRTLSFQWLAGARWFRFDEFLQFGSVAGGSEFGSNGGADEAYLDLDVENNLYGGQIGGRADWRVGRCWRVFGGTKVGIFANEIEFDTRLYRGDGATAVFASTGNAFDLSADKTDVSFLAQIDLGVSYDFTKHWSATIGYRAVALTGIALADDQVPAFLAAENDWTDIDSAGSMILHGGFGGLEYRW